MLSDINSVETVEMTTYDFTFIGLGAGNSLILLSLIKNNLISGKKVIVIESSLKNNNDKTYCFWADRKDAIVCDLSPIISYQFEKIRIDDSLIQDISDQPYYYIRSIDLYDYTLERLKDENINILRDEVTIISDHKKEYHIETKNSIIKTSKVFDSRPPYQTLSDNDIFLKQSFIGWHVKFEKSVFDHSSFEMMNFNVDQNGYTQFLYTIPFNSHEALIELTRFGLDEINEEYASEVLKTYISEKYGDYALIAHEIGCIPMTTFINKPSTKSGVLNTGISANMIKPSTGYGFKNMYSFATEVSNQLSQVQNVNFNKINITQKNRFKFYDTLLLIILLKWPHKGKYIFMRLFEKQSALVVFKFLDEKTNYLEELKIFASLQFTPFLRALHHLLKRKKQLRYVLSFQLILVYLLISKFSADTAQYFGYTALLFGLLTIGIPHGALDHLLVQTKNSSLSFFIAKYTLGIFFYYLLWQLLPSFSLVLFIIFSSFHFGESEMIAIGTNRQNPIPKLKSFLLGLSILMFIISTHREESIKIISYLNPDCDLTIFNSNVLSLFVSILAFSYILFLGFENKKNRHFGLLLLLFLGVQVPLILAFGLYFIMQHSKNAWEHIKQRLNSNTAELMKKSFIYNLGAMTVFGLIILNADTLKSLSSIWGQFFIFLACISLPHFLIMHLFYKRMVD